MKKVISLILALVLVMGLSVTAFADEITSNGGTTSITVKGTYSAATTGDTVSVDVAWGAMEFTYQAAGSYWDSTTHTTKTNSAASWTANGNNITITNHSNVGITAYFSFTAGVTGVDGKFYDAATDGKQTVLVSLNRAEENSELTSQQATVYFVIEEGAITESTENLGAITITITKTVTNEE